MVNTVLTTIPTQKILIVTVQDSEFYTGKGGKPTNIRFPTTDVEDTYKKVTKFSIDTFGKNNVNLNDMARVLTINKYEDKLTSYILGLKGLSRGETLDKKLDF